MCSYNPCVCVACLKVLAVKLIEMQWSAQQALEAVGITANLYELQKFLYKRPRMSRNDQQQLKSMQSED